MYGIVLGIDEQIASFSMICLKVIDVSARTKHISLLKKEMISNRMS